MCSREADHLFHLHHITSTRCAVRRMVWSGAKCDLNSTVAHRRSAMLEQGQSEVVEILESLDTKVSEVVELSGPIRCCRSKPSFSLPQSALLEYLWCIQTVVTPPNCRVELLSSSVAELFEFRIRSCRPLALHPVLPPSSVREVDSTCHTSRDMHCDSGIRNGLDVVASVYLSVSRPLATLLVSHKRIHLLSHFWER